MPAAADDTAAEEQAAFAAAVDRVAPAVVQIETVGGLERVEGVLLGTGPTTGLAVDPDGYIISSAFNFIGKPASILVRLPDGARKPARLVATDHARMLVLLKIEAERPLPVCEIAPRRQMRVGQWTIAVGRTFPGDRPNMAVGILSAARPGLGPGDSDRRRRLAEQLRRTAGGYPRPGDGRARAALAPGRR